MLDFSIYLLYRAGSALVSALPLRLLFSLGETLGLIAWMLLGRYRRLAQRNLAIAFREEKSAADLRSLTRRHFQRLGANLLCSVKLGTMPLEEVAECVSLENADLVHHELRAGRPVVPAYLKKVVPRPWSGQRAPAMVRWSTTQHYDSAEGRSSVWPRT